MNPRSLISRESQAYFCEVDGEIVLFHPREQEYFKLAAVGAAVWRLLEKPRPFTEIVKSLCEEYVVDEEVCREQVEGFIGDLRAARLAQVLESE